MAAARRMVERRKAALVLDMQRGAETAGAEEVQGEWRAGQGPSECKCATALEELP